MVTKKADSAITLNRIVTVFTLVQAALRVPVRRVADIFGRKRVFTES
jgi:hypothetical protein